MSQCTWWPLRAGAHLGENGTGRMLYQKGGTDHELCQHCSDCGHKGWTWPGSTGHCQNPNPGSLSHDIEGSCQSPPQGCHPAELCPPQPGCCPAPQSCKPRRRVEVSPVPPVCPPPVKIHRRPLEQHRPRPPCPEPDSCGKPRRRVEQCPEHDEEPPVVLQPLPLQHRCPCIRRCPRAVPRCCPPAVPLPPHPGHQQQQQKVTLVPLCVKN
ncbi:putative small proline-rich protein 5 [Cinclus cinclus]|uniref:putative small proline-rich protein 5 n=1 Tax=Cinclus cinclus TaxID=127875 RepID=UPI002E1180E7